MAASCLAAIPTHLEGGRSTQPSSSYNSIGSSIATASSSSNASTNPSGQRTPRKGPGRPPTARIIWQQQVMKRRLVRLYLYTPESILSTEQISRIISEISKQEENKRRPVAGLNMQALNCTDVQTKIRSTQYQLQRLLWDGYRHYRPRNLGEARERIKAFRRIRHGRVSKYVRSQAPHHKHNNSRPGSIVLSESASLPILPARSELRRYHPYYRLDSRASRSNTIDDDQRSLRTPSSDSGSYFHLSWVREKFRDISQQSLRSSFYSDIRSLLSRRSLRSSRASRQPVAITTGIDILPTTDSVNNIPTDKKAKLIKLCCQYRSDCIHRKFLQTASLQSLPAELENEGLRQKDFTMHRGRDVWNHTPFHLAAEWASDELAIPLVVYFLEQRPCQCQVSSSHNAGQRLNNCEAPYHQRTPGLLNVKNIDGETFMHVLSRRWCKLVFPPDIPASSFCSLVIAEGFDLDLRDGLERTFFDCLIDQMRHFSPDTEAERMLHYISWKLSVPLSEAGIPSDAFELVNCGLRNTDFENLLFILQVYEDMSKINAEINTPNSWKGENLRRLLVEHHPNLSTVVDRDIEINEYDRHGRTHLTALINRLEDPALQGMNVPTCEEIKDWMTAKPDLSLVDSRGDTPLHYAVRAGFPQVVGMLIDAGINTNARNLAGVSAMDLAVARYERIAPPNSKDLSVAYARAHGILVRLFDSGRGSSR
ncbi:ankyrin [Nemania sp. FL0031]|nr:ankyrin [Nemania sp. FL0031]